MPGSVNASPRSAASSSANARDPRCSAHPYGYSTRYFAPSPKPTSAVDAISTRRPPNPGTTPSGTFSRSIAAASRTSPTAGTVSGEDNTSTGITSSNASVSPASDTVTRTRARPTVRPAASNLTSTDPPAGTSTICGAVSAKSMTAGSRLVTVTVAAPAVFNWLITTAPNAALSPTARNRGNVGFSVTGLLMRISVSADPNRELPPPATAMMRYVVSDSGSVTATDACPRASVTTEPSQNASVRKSLRTVPGPA